MVSEWRYSLADGGWLGNSEGLGESEGGDGFTVVDVFGIDRDCGGGGWYGLGRVSWCYSKCTCYMMVRPEHVHQAEGN